MPCLRKAGQATRVDCACLATKGFGGTWPAGRKTTRWKWKHRAIREGLLLGVQQVRAILSDDPFANL